MVSARLLHTLQSRHSRRKAGICVAEGLRCVREVLRLMPDAVQQLFCTEAFLASEQAGALGCPRERLSVVSPQEYEALAETETPQGILAVLKIPRYSLSDEAPMPFVLILDRIADPGNLGTILRTAWAIGMNAVWLVKGCADPWSPKVMRAGMGAQCTVRTYLFESLEAAVEAAKTRGVRKVWCTMPDRGLSLFDDGFSLENAALVIGNEANGISNPEVGMPVTIPMPGHAESLNAAQAATVFLVEALRGKKG